MANKETNWLLIVAVIALAYFAFFNEPAAPTTTTTTTTPTGAVCGSDTTPDLDINGYDIENPGTALTEATNLYRKVGNTAWTAFTAGTAITNLEVGADYEIIMGISASDFIDNAYGESFKTGPIPCKESTVMDKGMYNDEIETSLTATFYNQNHDNTYTDTVGAGATKKVYAKFEAGSDEVFGNPFIATSGLGDNGKHRALYPNVWCVNLNKTTWDTPDKVMFGSEELKSVPIPQQHSTPSTHTGFCYEFPVVTDLGQEVSIVVDADDTTAPTCDEQTYLYAANFYIDSNGKNAWGIETDEGADVAIDDADTLYLNFTDGSGANGCG